MTIYRALRYLAALAMLGLTSCVVSDGPYVNVAGRSVESGTLDQLKSRGANVDQVIQSLGPPMRTVGTPPSALIYESVRERTSRETVIGMPVSESTQRVVDRWTLDFMNGRLVDVKVTQEITNR